MTQTVSTKSIQSLASSKLTGALPAISGAALTGVSAGVYNSTSNPSPTSNKTLGFIWANSVTGEMFNCIDATTNANIWKNVGAGITHVSSHKFQGEIAGFTIGGWGGKTGDYNANINKYSFSSGDNAIEHGDISHARYQGAGNASATYGYCSGGYGPGSKLTNANIIDKFAFSNNVTGTDVGNLTVGRRQTCGQSSSTHGYTTGGTAPPNTNVCDKFSFASNGNATDVGDNTLSRSSCAGMSSTTHGFTAGGTTDPTDRNEIDKFSFASNNNATDVGDLSQARTGTQGASSSTHGYIMSGYVSSPAGITTRIDKFAFATNNNSTNIGDVTASTGASAGSTSSSLTHGYLAGGPSHTTIIQRTSFATDGDAVSTLQNLTHYQQSPAGCQY